MDASRLRWEPIAIGITSAPVHSMSEDLLSAYHPVWLPGEISSVVGPLDGRVEDLFPAEAVLVAKAVASRRVEFATGRVLARRLLADLGYEASPLLSNADRSPRWPTGVIGSIAHTKGLCGVAIARSSHSLLGIGIDVEQDAPLEDRVSKYVLTEREQRWLESLPDPIERARLAMVTFSAKEAIYKCLHPRGNAGLEFGDVELKITAAMSTIVVHPGPELARRVPEGASLECGFFVKSGFIQTAAVLKG